MTVQIKAGDVFQLEQWEELVRIIEGRSDDDYDVLIDLENISNIDLAKFNLLVALHMKFKRMDKTLVYENCKQDGLKNLVDKTNFNNVFHN